MQGKPTDKLFLNKECESPTKAKSIKSKVTQITSRDPKPLSKTVLLKTARETNKPMTATRAKNVTIYLKQSVKIGTEGDLK